jgi:HEAT repeat protein
MTQLEEALSLAGSGEWRERKKAAPLLVAQSEAKADEALSGLLDDQDLAVVEAAAVALLRRGDQSALRRVIRGLENDEPDVVDQILGAVQREARRYRDVRPGLEHLATDPEESPAFRTNAKAAAKAARARWWFLKRST